MVLPKKPEKLEWNVCWYFRGSFGRFGGIGRWLSAYRVGILYIASEEEGKCEAFLGMPSDDMAGDAKRRVPIPIEKERK